MNDRYAAPSFVVAVVSLVVGYLAFAHDSNAWPYGGPSWIWLPASIVCTLGGLLLIAVKYVRASFKLWPLAFGITLVIVGSIVGTATALSVDNQSQTRHFGTPKVEITNVEDHQVVDLPLTLSGNITEPTRAGESLWVFVGTLPSSGDEPDRFYLQMGPCEQLREKMTWRCAISLSSVGPRRVRLYIASVEGDDTPKLVQRLMDGARLDYENMKHIPTDRVDQRSAETLASFGEVTVLDFVTVGLRE